MQPVYIDIGKVFLRKCREKLILSVVVLHLSGWKREIVIRGTQGSGPAVKRCDVYYYTPENTKLVGTGFIAHLNCVVSVS